MQISVIKFGNNSTKFLNHIYGSHIITTNARIFNNRFPFSD